MMQILINLLDNTLECIELFNGENKVAELVIDYTGTDYATWTKWVGFKMPDGTDGVHNLGTTASVNYALTSAELKKGYLRILPFAKDLTDATIEKHFEMKQVPITDWKLGTLNNSSVEDNLIDYFDAKIAVKSVTTNTLAAGENADVTITPNSDGYDYIFDIPQGETVDISNLMTKDGLNSAVEKLTFDITPATSNPLLEGQLRWNATDKTLDIGMDGDGIIQQVGLETFYPKCRNNDTVQINDGELVMFDGSIGNSGVLLVKRATTTMPLPGLAMGIATENIAVNGDGRITWFGLVRNIQTNGANYGETWADGQVLYNGATSGALSKTKPVAPRSAVMVGVVLNAHATSGSILVRPLFFPFLSNLSDVAITNPLTDDSIRWDGTKWVNVPVYSKSQADILLSAKQNTSPKATFNADGGFMVKLINKTGAVTVKGHVVRVNSALDNSVVKTIDTAPDPVGVFYEAGVADGQEAWVVISGIADVYFIGSTTRGHLARTFVTSEAGYVTGQALSEAVPSSPFASDKHFCEIGHVITSRTGAGLAKVVLHFN